MTLLEGGGRVSIAGKAPGGASISAGADACLSCPSSRRASSKETGAAGGKRSRVSREGSGPAAGIAGADPAETVRTMACEGRSFVEGPTSPLPLAPLPRAGGTIVVMVAAEDRPVLCASASNSVAGEGSSRAAGPCAAPSVCGEEEEEPLVVAPPSVRTVESESERCVPPIVTSWMCSCG